MTEKDYISREAAIAYIKENQCKRCSDIGLCGKCAVLSAVKLFESVPSADVRSVVKAKIVDMRYTEDDGEWKCSHCGRQFTLCVCGKDVTRKIHYCPNCGADMREES